MSSSETTPTCDFLLERRLRDLEPSLHEIYRKSIFAIDLLLTNYKSIFPFYTNHTLTHSEQVINYSNIIAGPSIIDRLNADEIYILLMGAVLHDVGMGVCENDFNRFVPQIPELSAYIEAHPGLRLGDYTRSFHEDLGAQFIRHYAPLFEIPSEDHIHCIAQLIRGHRHRDLLDLQEYPSDYRMQTGRTVNLPYLTSLVKLGDELDVTSDRNLMFDYSIRDAAWSDFQALCYKCHGAIKRLVMEDDRLVLCFSTDEEEVLAEILKTRSKVERTFAEYCGVVKERTDFENRISRIDFQKI